MSDWWRLRRPVTIGAILAAGWLLAACQGVPGAHDAGERSSLSAERIWQSGQCGPRTAGSRWIEDRAALEEVVRAAGPRSPDADEPDVPAADFERHRLVLVALGEQPTAGYGMELQRDTLDVQGDRAVLRIAVTRPAADSMQAQVVTAPCMLVAVERGGYSALEIRDRESAGYGTLTLD